MAYATTDQWTRYFRIENISLLKQIPVFNNKLVIARANKD